jgi:hypothetical protein
MCNHTAVAKAFVTTACALAFACLTIGTGVNSSWAGSDTPAGNLFSHIHSQTDSRPSSTIRHRSRHAEACVVVGQECNMSEDCCSRFCDYDEDKEDYACACMLIGEKCNDDFNCCGFGRCENHVCNR